MSLSQLPVKLAIAAGTIAASLLGATFTGCSSTQSNSVQANAPYGQPGPGPNGQQTASYNMTQQSLGPGANPDLNIWTPQNRQAFLAESQRLGSQPNLTAQDVVAMKRSGVPDQQIAIAIQQRGTALRTAPGAAEFLAQNGVNPAVLGGGAQSRGSLAGMYAARTPNSGAPSSFGAGGSSQPANSMANVFDNGSTTTAAAYPPTQGEPGRAQAAGFETTAPAAFGDPAGPGNAIAPPDNRGVR